MASITELKPQKVWTYFSRICSIPHTSGNEKRISEELALIAKTLDLKCETSPCGNVYIYKPASDKYRDKPTIILQAHMDMVGVKKNGTNFDFLTDCITPVIDENGFVHAIDTTLGADDGIGVAMILAILEEKEIEHPPIKAIFTVGEETDMVGANQLKADDINASYAINIDSENLGEICIGCAGGSSFNIIQQPEIMEVPLNYAAIKIHISRATGGHSGIDIDKNRINAGIALFTLIGSLANEDIKAGLSALDSGTVRNSIPSEGFAIITVPTNCVSKAKHTITDISERIKTKYIHSDPNLCITIDDAELPNIMLSIKSTENLIKLSELNTRVIERTSNGEPLTSCNVGVIKFDEGKIILNLLARFATSTGKKLITDKITNIVDATQSQIISSESYSYWEPDFESRLSEIANNEFLKLNKISAEKTVIHAGLECGLFKNLNPNIDIISIGPDVIGAHSIKEAVNIESVEKCYTWLQHILKSI